MTHWLLLQIVSMLQNHPYLLGGLCVLLIASQWTVFTKAGQPGWAVLIPFYGQIVMARVGGQPWWMGLLLLVPFINVLAMFAISMATARRFGRGPLFGLGLTFASPIFTPILAFGGSRYRLHG